MSPSDPSDEEIDELLSLDGEEFDRRLEELGKKYPPQLLPPDLSELFRAVRRAAALREIWSPDIPLYMFERFETHGALIGGMGVVIEARDLELERKVAIKLWKQSGPEAQAALLAEAKVLAKLSHPNVVTVHETGRWGERVFFVMEWIDGVDGHKWMMEPRSWREVRDVFVGAGMGLAAAHDAGIQHRDFKPANILIGNDARVVVADFGIADSLRAVDSGDPQWGTPVGTPTYMAPERLRGGRGDARSDQFSFCVAMWRGLYGLRPYAGTTDQELLASIEQGAIREVPGVEVPAWLSAVVRKGLAEDPDHRFQSMHELLEALRDEPPDEEEGDDNEVFDESIVEDDGRVLHTPEHRDEPAVAREGSAEQDLVEVRGRAPDERESGETSWSRWPVVAVSFMASIILVMGFVIFTRTPAPEPSVTNAVEVQPYHAILGLVAADEFLEAEKLWRSSELTDAESLRVAEECLTRADQLAPVDRRKAKQAVLTAYEISSGVRQSGATEEAREHGGRLASTAADWRGDEPQPVE